MLCRTLLLLADKPLARYNRIRMNKNEKQIIDSLVERIPELTAGQAIWVDRVVSVFQEPCDFVLHNDQLMDDAILHNFGDAMRVHHCFSSEPFSKDKFEHVLVHVMNMSGKYAELSPKGNPGHDLSIEESMFSLKTQADKNLKKDKIWISKFMELGKGDWSDNPDDLKGLMGQYMAHLDGYDRIIILRALEKQPDWKYELVEIPKALLLQAQQGRLEMKMESKQNPKPGYCYVEDKNNNNILQLYFDGGGERKLQIKHLEKSHCIVHATWGFSIPPE